MATIPSRFPPLSQSGGTITGDLTVTGNETVGNNLTVNMGALNLTNGAAINFGNPATTGSDLYLSSTNTLTTDRALDIGGVLDVTGSALGVATPAKHSMIAWTFDPVNAVSSVAAISQSLYLNAVYVTKSVTTSKIWYAIGSTAGAGVTAANAGVYNAAGTLLGQVDISASLGANNVFSATLAVALTPGMYWLAFAINATTMPNPLRTNPVDAGMYTVNQTASTARFAVNGTTVTGTLPASITPGSNDTSTNAKSWWMAVS